MIEMRSGGFCVALCALWMVTACGRTDGVSDGPRGSEPRHSVVNGFEDGEIGRFSLHDLGENVDSFGEYQGTWIPSETQVRVALERCRYEVMRVERYMSGCGEGHSHWMAYGENYSGRRWLRMHVSCSKYSMVDCRQESCRPPRLSMPVEGGHCRDDSDEE